MCKVSHWIPVRDIRAAVILSDRLLDRVQSSQQPDRRKLFLLTLNSEAQRPFVQQDDWSADSSQLKIHLETGSWSNSFRFLQIIKSIMLKCAVPPHRERQGEREGGVSMVSVDETQKLSLIMKPHVTLQLLNEKTWGSSSLTLCLRVQVHYWTVY